MKIALVFFDLSIPAGGQRQFLSLAQELKKKGHAVKIYCTKIDENIFPDLWMGLESSVVQVKQLSSIKYKLFRFNRNYYDYLNKAKTVAATLDPDFDAVNCHEDFAFRVAYFYKKRNPQARIIWSLNNVAYFYDRRGNVAKRLKSYVMNLYKNLRDKKFFRAVDLVTSLSKYEEHWCEERSLPVKIIRSGLDFEKFFAPVRKIEGVCKIAAIGALGPHRRFEDAIYAAAALKKKGRQVHLTIVCKQFGTEAYGLELLKLAEMAGVKEEVEFLFNGLEDTKLIELMKNSHVFLHSVYLPPPQYYGWGLVVFEAMAAGLAVVLCSVTGATEVLTDGENALFVRPLDWQCFAEKIDSLLADPNLYSKIAANGQTFVRSNISWTRYAENMLKAFEGSL